MVVTAEITASATFGEEEKNGDFQSKGRLLVQNVFPLI